MWTPRLPACTAMHPLPGILLCGDLPEECADSSVCCHLEQAAPAADALGIRLMEFAVWWYPAYEAGVGGGRPAEMARRYGTHWAAGVEALEQRIEAPTPPHRAPGHTSHPTSGRGAPWNPRRTRPKAKWSHRKRNVLLWDLGLPKGLQRLKSPSHRLSIVFA